MTYSVLVIGCGRIGFGATSMSPNSHICALHSHHSFSVDGIYDSDPDRCHLVSSLIPTATYTSIHEALEAKYDVITISSPDPTHYEHINTILNSPNCPRLIFSEKPICQTSYQLRCLESFLGSLNVSLLVNHTRRFSTQHRFLRQLINSSTLGVPTSVDATYYGGLIHNGIHSLDTILFLLNEKILWSKLSSQTYSRFPADPCYSLVGLLQETHTPVNLNAVDERNYQLFEFDLRFSLGRIVIEDFGADIRVYERYTNKEHEYLLRLKDCVPHQPYPPLTVAYTEIAEFLDRGIIPHASFPLLNEVAPSYDMVWSALDLVHN